MTSSSTIRTTGRELSPASLAIAFAAGFLAVLTFYEALFLLLYVRRRDPGSAVQHEANAAVRRSRGSLAIVLGRRMGDGLPPHRAALLLRDRLLGGLGRHRRHSADPPLRVRRRAAQNRSSAAEHGWAVRYRVPAQRHLGRRLGAVFEAVRPDAERELTTNSCSARLVQYLIRRDHLDQWSARAVGRYSDSGSGLLARLPRGACGLCRSFALRGREALPLITFNYQNQPRQALAAFVC